MTSIFSKIVKGDIPCYKLAESDKYFAFLDIRPLQKGHCLVIPKNEIDYIFDLEEDELAGLIKFAQRVAKAMKRVIVCKRIGLTVMGLEVPHAHIHLIPINEMKDMEFSRKPLELSTEEFKTIATNISSAFE